jgi:hypothetical protein
MPQKYFDLSPPMYPQKTSCTGILSGADWNHSIIEKKLENKLTKSKKENFICSAQVPGPFLV